MKIIKTCLTAVISSMMIFSPMAYADKWSDQFPHIKATGDISGDCCSKMCFIKGFSLL